MKKTIKLGIVFAVLLCCAGCATKKVAINESAKIEKKDIVVDNTIETKTVEVIRTEKIVPGDTIEKKVSAKDIVSDKGVSVENEAQFITINYDKESDSFLIRGIQKAKRELQEIKREIEQKQHIATQEKSKTTVDTKIETPLPVDERWSGVEWAAFWGCVAVVAFLIWKFRGGIMSILKMAIGFIKRLF